MVSAYKRSDKNVLYLRKTGKTGLTSRRVSRCSCMAHPVKSSVLSCSMLSFFPRILMPFGSNQTDLDLLPGFLSIHMRRVINLTSHSLSGAMSNAVSLRLDASL